MSEEKDDASLDNRMQQNALDKLLKIPAEKVFIPRDSLLTKMLQQPNFRSVYYACVAIFGLAILQHCLEKPFTNDLSLPAQPTSRDSVLSTMQTLAQSWWYWIISVNIATTKKAILIFISMNAICISLPFSGIYLWAITRRAVIKHSLDKKGPNTCQLLNLVDVASVLAYVSYQTAFLLIPAYIIAMQQFSSYTAMHVLCEQVRLQMKAHAFVRSWAEKVVSGTGEDVIQSLSPTQNPSQCKITPPQLPAAPTALPRLSCYAYYMIAPTLIYRDAYPRSPRIRWGFFLSHFCQALLALHLAVKFVTIQFVAPFADHFPNQQNKNILSSPSTEWPRLILAFMREMIPCCLAATAVQLLSFYALLHAWLNAFAELLRFADRQFYTDWWTSCDWGRYYRTWNEVVYDWLHTYVYRDVQLLMVWLSSGKQVAKAKINADVANNNNNQQQSTGTQPNAKDDKLRRQCIRQRRVVASTAVFMLSAFYHEYIITGMLHFFYPVLLIQFAGVGFILFLLAKEGGSQVGNLMLWFSLCLGNAINLAGYTLEAHAQKHCAPVFSDWRDLVMPRSWQCHVPTPTATLLGNTSQ